jgi:predicted TIM-barrel fold metal-dependent hydrolase
MTTSTTPPPIADCHVHIFDPDRFPYRNDAARRPARHETAPVDLLMAVLDAAGVSHALLVTPTTGYGPDNSSVIDAIARYPGRLRGIAVVESDVADRELKALKAAGFAGVRVDLLARGTRNNLSDGWNLAARLRDHGMILQIQTAGDLLDDVADRLMAEAGLVVIDHMGRPDPTLGLGQRGFRCLLRMAERPDAAVKLSGPFRFSTGPFPYDEADPYALAVLSAFGPERCVWGSDWPFVGIDHRMDYGPALAALDRWVPGPEDRRLILWETPRRLFGFGRS